MTKQASLATVGRRQDYETPQVELLNAHVEKGFVNSLTTGSEAGDGLREVAGVGDEIFN